jgi:hypothetical protein
VDLHLRLQLGDPPARCDQLGVVGAGDPGQLPGVDQMLAVPDVDGLLADVQTCSNLGDTAASGDQVEDLATELWRVTLGHAERSSELLG